MYIHTCTWSIILYWFLYIERGCSSRFTQQVIWTQLSSELGRVKAVSKKSGAPPQLHHCQYKLALSQPLAHLAFCYGVFNVHISLSVVNVHALL